MPLILPQVALEFSLARRRRRAWREHPLNNHKETSATLENALVLISEAETSLEVRSDTLDPELREPLEAAHALGLKVEVFLDAPGIMALRNAGSPLSVELWVPESEQRMRRLIVDLSYVMQSALIGGSTLPFGPENDKIVTMTHYLLQEVRPG